MTNMKLRHWGNIVQYRWVKLNYWYFMYGMTARCPTCWRCSPSLRTSPASWRAATGRRGCRTGHRHRRTRLRKAKATTQVRSGQGRRTHSIISQNIFRVSGGEAEHQIRRTNGFTPAQWHTETGTISSRWTFRPGVALVLDISWYTTEEPKQSFFLDFFSLFKSKWSSSPCWTRRLGT